MYRNCNLVPNVELCCMNCEGSDSATSQVLSGHKAGETLDLSYAYIQAMELSEYLLSGVPYR